MKMKYNGCDCHYVKRGGIYEAEYISDRGIKVTGKNFLYTFTYNNKAEMSAEWSEE